MSSVSDMLVMRQRVAASERDHWPTDGLDTVIAAGSGLPSSLDQLNCWLGSQRKAATDRYCKLLAGGYTQKSDCNASGRSDP
jgi:hypothetical protein